MVPQTTQPIIVQSGSKSALDYAIPVVVIGGLAWYGRKLYLDHQAEKESEKVGVEAQATASTGIEQAFNPSGITWLKAIDGTNAKQIMDSTIQAFNEGKKYSDIADSYKKMTKGRVLMDDLKKELSTDQYNTYLNVLRILSKRPEVNQGDTIVTKAAVITRKTPYIDGTPSLIDRRGNSIDLIKNPNTVVGVASGKQFLSISRDTLLANSQSTATLFLEVITYVLAESKTYKIWVAAALVTPSKNKPSSFNSIYVMNKSNYDKADASSKPWLE